MKTKQKTIADYRHRHATVGATQEPDPQPGHYYVSCVNEAGKHALLSGPYPEHATALGLVEKARRLGEKFDARAVWYAFGTCRLDLTATAPAGVFQKNGYGLDLEPVFKLENSA